MLVELNLMQVHFVAHLTRLIMNSMMIKSGLSLRVHIEKFIFLFLNQNICCGYSKVSFYEFTSFCKGFFNIRVYAN